MYKYTAQNGWFKKFDCKKIEIEQKNATGIKSQLTVSDFSIFIGLKLKGKI